MLTRGVSDIRGIHGLNPRPGPMTGSSGLLKLYRLAAEKDNLLKKLTWVRRQQDQTDKRLSEIASTMQKVKKVVEDKATKELISNSHPELRHTRIEY